MCKFLTSIVADEKQKGCLRNTRGTKDQLLIDKAVMKKCSRRRVRLSMVWIDYWNAYDMPYSWIKKPMEVCGGYR